MKVRSALQIYVSFRCRGVGESGCVQMGDRDRGVVALSLGNGNRGGSGSRCPIIDGVGDVGVGVGSLSES